MSGTTCEAPALPLDSGIANVRFRKDIYLIRRLLHALRSTICKKHSMHVPHTITKAPPPKKPSSLVPRDDALSGPREMLYGEMEYLGWLDQALPRQT